MFNSNEKETTPGPARPRQGSTISLMDTLLASYVPPRSPTEPRPASAPVDIVRPNSTDALKEGLTPPSAEVEPGSPPSEEELKLKKLQTPLSTRHFPLFAIKQAQAASEAKDAPTLDDSQETEETNHASLESLDEQNESSHLVGVFNFEP